MLKEFDNNFKSNIMRKEGFLLKGMKQEENIDTKNAISEMKLAINQMDDIFIPSIRETAKSAGIELD